jgi:hypothetical protein
MPDEWRLGRDPLIRYVDFCIVWIGKALHERELKRYPGTQHYGETVRVERDRPDEFCGCGSERLYGDCHREADRALGVLQRYQQHYAAERGYLAEIEVMGRSSMPPEFREL